LHVLDASGVRRMAAYGCGHGPFPAGDRRSAVDARRCVSHDLQPVRATPGTGTNLQAAGGMNARGDAWAGRHPARRSVSRHELALLRVARTCCRLVAGAPAPTLPES